MTNPARMTILEVFDRAELLNESIEVDELLQEIRRRYVDVATGYNKALDALNEARDELARIQELRETPFA